jgi:hypothetical protein
MALRAKSDGKRLRFFFCRFESGGVVACVGRARMEKSEEGLIEKLHSKSEYTKFAPTFRLEPE